MITIHEKAEHVLRNEKSFELFRHSDLFCCVQRMSMGNLNGYVAVPAGHPLFKKHYSDKIHMNESPQFNGNYIGLLCSMGDNDHELGIYSLDMALQVHGGLTYANDQLCGIEQGLLGELWWFGFDTAHSGDLRPFQTDIDRQFPIRDDEYRDFEYVKEQTKKLAEQLAAFGHK